MSAQANMAARYEHEIPEGYEARIEGNKVIIELAESEDERIRKDIVFLIGHVPTMNEERREKCLAWLEKQKEQKPIFSDDIEQEIRDSWLNGWKTCNDYCSFKSTIEHFYKLGVADAYREIKNAQNPVEWSEKEVDLDDEMETYISRFFNTAFNDETNTEVVIRKDREELSTLDFYTAMRYFFELGRNAK